MAETTKRARRSQLRRYKKFCKKFNKSPFPCSASRAAIYAAHLAKDLTPVSIRNYLSAVWYTQKMKGYKDHSDNFILKQTLNGIERSFDPTKLLTRYPLTPQDLHNMHDLLDFSVANDRNFWLTALICYRGILRVSHITSATHTLFVKNVITGMGFMGLTITTSKTDQFGRDPYTVFFKDIPGSIFCIRSRLLDVVKGSSKEDTLVNISYECVNSKLKMLAVLLELPVGRVSTHSFRHGGTAMLQALGMSVDCIMRKGHWKSAAVRRYLHQSTGEMLKLESDPCKYLSSI